MLKQRIDMALNIGGYASIILGIGWTIFFGAMQMWALFVFDALVALAGFGVLLLAKNGRARTAIYLLLTSMFVLANVMCLFLDIPSPAAPRAVHHYFLVLAALSCLFFSAERKLIKFGIPAFFVITYLLYASSNIGFISPYTLPDSIRVAGTWVNNCIAMLLVYAIFYIMLSDIYVPSQTEQDLKIAIQNNQLELYYQPQVDERGVIWGAEALIRWNHPTRGLVPPNEFIPLAEQTGLILPMGEWVLKTGCAQLIAWAKIPALAHLSLSLNVSAQQFYQQEFVNQTILIVEGVGANKLKLELTESSLVKDIESIINKMGILKAAGIGFALDDFGTGYSSLNYLKRLPLDLLKIDKSFVLDVLTDENDAAIATTIATLGNSLGLKVVAEGVENVRQRAFLIEHGCTSFQGFLFSPPLPLAAFEAFVAASTCNLHAEAA